MTLLKINQRSCTSKSECLSSVEPTLDTREPITSGRQQQATPTPTTTSGQLESAFKSQLKWISSESAAGKCVDLQSIVPDKMPITSTGKVSYHDDCQPSASQLASSRTNAAVCSRELHSLGPLLAAPQRSMLISRRLPLERRRHSWHWSIMRQEDPSGGAGRTFLSLKI